MADEFDVSCPKCSVTFTVTRDLCGEMAECSECATVFEVPFPEETEAAQSTETGAIKGTIAEPEAVEATNTVKLSRTGIGMIPSLKDSFEFGTKTPSGAPLGTQSAVQQPRVGAASKFNIPPAQQPSAPPQKPPTPPAPQAAPGKTGVTFKKPSVPPPPPPVAPSSPPQIPPPSKPAFNPTQTQSAGTVTDKAPVQIPPWAKIVIHKDEEIYSCAESSSNPIKNVVLVTLPVLLCVILPAIPDPFSYLAGLILAVATFVSAFLMMRKSSKTLLVLTSQRAISVNGKTKLEAKR